MAEIITNLHPDNDINTNLYPNIKKENIPSKSISTDKLDDNVLSLIGSLKPSGTDTSTNILAFTSNKGIYVATDNGHWYYWNGSAYADGGVYQSSEDIEQIKEDIDKLSKKTFLVNTVRKTVTSIPNITKIESAYFSATSTDIKYTNFDSYDSYYYYVDEDEELYVASNSISSLTYISICTIENAQPITTEGVINGTNGVRVRKSENNLPTEENPLKLTKGMAIAFTIPKNSDLTLVYNNVLTNTINPNVILNDTQINQVLSSTGTIKTIKVEYINGDGVDHSTERVNVYIPTYNGYVKYEFLHCVRSDINSNIWRIGFAYSCDDNLNVIEALTTSGEWECAVKASGRPDFSGGIAHGDEVLSTINFYLDGKNITLSDISSITDCNEFRVVQYSTLYDANDSTSLYGYHGSEHIWNVNKENHLEIKQSLKWVNSQTLDNCYMAMFPVSKTVTDTYFDDVDYDAKPINSLPIKQYKCNELNLYKTSKNVKCRFGVSKYIDGFASGGFSLIHDNGGMPYNKCYFVICQSGDISSNTLWKTVTYYNIDISK